MILGAITPLSHADPRSTRAVEATVAAVDGDSGDPIQVHIERVTPSVLGPTQAADPDTDAAPASPEIITVTGTVTNTSSSVWSEIHVYPLTSFQPLTTSTALSRALDSDPGAYIGSRLLNLRDEVPGELGPGDTAGFSLSLPRDQLRISGEPGVYWLGLHILGTEEGVRTSEVDGRARILLPLAAASTHTTAALVAPVRGRVTREADGSVADVAGWESALGPDGRLGRQLALAGLAPQAPLTWMVDPAVLDAAQRLAAGNPAFTLEETPAATGNSRVAEQWLTQFAATAADDDVWAIPYGDLDTAAALRAGRASLLTRAIQQSVTVLEGLGLEATPALAPQAGRLTWDVLDRLGSTPALLTRGAVRDGASLRLDTDRGTPLVTSIQASASGGALQTRQEILALAAIHAATGSEEPLVIQLPTDWDPGSDWATSDFFGGLATPLLTLTDLTSILALPASRVVNEADNDLREPSSRNELPSESIAQANRLIQVGRTLGSLITGENTVADTVVRWALLGVSTHARANPVGSLQWLSERHAEIEALLGQVRIEAPTFVTMSSEQGPFQVTVENGLPVPVTVGVHARSLGGQLEVEEPDPVEVGAEQQRSIRLVASARGLGEYRLQLRPMTTEGDAFGATTELRIRSSRVGQFIWAGLGAGTLVLVGLIAIRVRRRMRARKQTPGPLLARLDRAQRDAAVPPADGPSPAPEDQ